jgi:hypothetical protein
MKWLRLRWILDHIISSENMLDYKLVYDDGKSNSVVELKEARVDHDNRTIILS